MRLALVDIVLFCFGEMRWPRKNDPLDSSTCDGPPPGLRFFSLSGEPGFRLPAYLPTCLPAYY